MFLAAASRAAAQPDIANTGMLGNLAVLPAEPDTGNQVRIIYYNAMKAADCCFSALTCRKIAIPLGLALNCRDTLGISVELHIEAS